MSEVPLMERVYRAEAEMPPSARKVMSWRMSTDIATDLARLGGALTLPERFILLGYPARVDPNLPPDSLIVVV